MHASASSQSRLTVGSGSLTTMTAMKHALVAATALALLVLGGCGGHHHEPSGSVSIWWADGGGSDTGEVCICEDTLLRMGIETKGDAIVTGGYWTVRSQPAFSTVVIDDPLNPTTTASFDTPGTYVLDYVVQFAVGWDDYETAGRLYIEAMPFGAG